MTQSNPHRKEDEPDQITGKTKSKKKKAFGLRMYSTLFNQPYHYEQWYTTERGRDTAFEKYVNETWWGRDSMVKRYTKVEKIER